MITLKNKFLIYAAGLLFAVVVPMTVSFIMLFFFADVNGGFPIKPESEEP